MYLQVTDIEFAPIQLWPRSKKQASHMKVSYLPKPNKTDQKSKSMSVGCCNFAWRDNWNKYEDNWY